MVTFVYDKGSKLPKGSGSRKESRKRVGYEFQKIVMGCVCLEMTAHGSVADGARCGIGTTFFDLCFWL